jgi:glycosyltransferase involved in cell wall biosynthesis
MLANVGRGLPHVMTSHDVFCHTRLSGILGWLKFRALEQMLRRLDVLIAVGNDARDDHLAHLPGLRNGPCRVVAIPNGIELARYEPRRPSGALRNELGLAAGVSLLGFLGRFMPQKGFLPLVDALSALAGGPYAGRFHLLAVGSGDFVREYKAEVERRGELRGRVTFREHAADVAPILRELDLLVIPSLWEACPILPMEALVSGIPVLGSDCIGLREVLRDTPSRTVPAGDPPALAAAIGRALDCPWKESATAGMAAARRRFDVRQRALELLTVLDSCVQTPPERQPAGEAVCSGNEAS